jgi:hypothetical protein
MDGQFSSLAPAMRRLLGLAEAFIRRTPCPFVTPKQTGEKVHSCHFVLFSSATNNADSFLLPDRNAFEL